MSPPKGIHHFFTSGNQRGLQQKKKLITYDGIACRTDLTITSRPTFDKHLLLQEIILCHTRSLI